MESEGFISLWKTGNSSQGLEGSKPFLALGFILLGAPHVPWDGNGGGGKVINTQKTKNCALYKAGVVEFHTGMKTRPWRPRVCSFGDGVFSPFLHGMESKHEVFG